VISLGTRSKWHEREQLPFVVSNRQQFKWSDP
jgi:hypothetical protein